MGFLSWPLLILIKHKKKRKYTLILVWQVQTESAKIMSKNKFKNISLRNIFCTPVLWDVSKSFQMIWRGPGFRFLVSFLDDEGSKRLSQSAKFSKCSKWLHIFYCERTQSINILLIWMLNCLYILRIILYCTIRMSEGTLFSISQHVEWWMSD